MKGFFRHQLVYKLLRHMIRPFLKWKFNYSCSKETVHHHPYIVLSNHNTDFDPFLVGLSFNESMYYVASDHIFRWGYISRIIEFLVSPIPRIKANREVETVLNIIRRLKAGANICIFAEGNRSFSGETGDIPESTGKLLKRSGTALITYRLDGGYFSSPRWSSSFRKGQMTGRVVKEYSPEDIRAMSIEELNDAIKRDLYINAYTEQEKNPVAFKGKRLAENLETALYLCPRCGSMNSLKGIGDLFSCSCGLKLKYTPYGYFTSEDEYEPPFDTILAWCRWQTEAIKEKVKNVVPSDQAITCDEAQSLWLIDKANKSVLITEGTLKLYSDRIAFTSDDKLHEFPLSSISDIAIHGKMVLIFSTTDRSTYEIKSNQPRSALKYLELVKALKESKGSKKSKKE